MENSVDRCERTVLHVSEMHPPVTEDVLYDLFKQCGLIEKVILKEEHALIFYKNPQSVMKAIDTLTGTTFNGQTIKIRPLRESSHSMGLEARRETADTGERYGSSNQTNQQTATREEPEAQAEAAEPDMDPQLFLDACSELFEKLMKHKPEVLSELVDRADRKVVFERLFEHQRLMLQVVKDQDTKQPLLQCLRMAGLFAPDK